MKIKCSLFLLMLSWGLIVANGNTLPQIFPRNSLILFQGDSITHGGRRGDMNHYLGHGFQAEIAMRYMAYCPDLNLEFANRGISGDTSSNLVARWHVDALPFTIGENGYDKPFPCGKGVRTPDFLSILVGINDYLPAQPKQGVSAENYERNIRYMVTNSLALNPSVRIILCEPFRLPEDTSSDFVRRQRIVRDLAAEYGLAFVPFQRLFSDILMKEYPRPGYWFWDAYHPTYAAHMRMADFWLENVESEFARQKHSQDESGRDADHKEENVDGR